MSVFGHLDDELRPIPHSRTIAHGAGTFSNFAVPGAAAVLPDCKAIAVYADSPGSILTVTATFQLDDAGGLPQTVVVKQSDGITPLVVLPSGGHELLSVTIDDGGVGHHGNYAVTASNLDPFPKAQASQQGIGNCPSASMWTAVDLNWPGGVAQVVFDSFLTNAPSLFSNAGGGAIGVTRGGIYLAAFYVTVADGPKAISADYHVWATIGTAMTDYPTRYGTYAETKTYNAYAQPETLLFQGGCQVLNGQHDPALAGTKVETFLELQADPLVRVGIMLTRLGPMILGAG